MQCGHCGYQSDGFDFFPHTNIYRCLACKDIVWVGNVPFLFCPPVCNKCGERLCGSELIRVFRMRPNTDMVQCPRCNTNSLYLKNSGTDYLVSYKDPVPEVNSVIHGLKRTSRSDDTVSELIIPCCNTSLLPSFSIQPGGLDAVPYGYHKFRVLAASETSLELEYLAPLGDEDDWYPLYGRVEDLSR